MRITVELGEVYGRPSTVKHSVSDFEGYSVNTVFIKQALNEDFARTDKFRVSY